MTNQFKDFDITELCSNDSAVRETALQRSNQAKEHPLEYCQFLTREITNTNDQFRASFGFLVLKMVISEVKLPLEVLLKMLEYFSSLFIGSKKKGFIKAFSAFLQALLLRIDSTQENAPKNIKEVKRRLASGACYLSKEKLLLEGKTSGLSI